MPPGRIFGQGLLNDGPVRQRQRLQVRLALRVQQHQFMGDGGGEGGLAGEQFLVDDGQAVLIREPADHSAEGLGSGVLGSHASRHRADQAGQILDQPEVRDLDVLVQQAQVLRFDVHVLQVMVLVHQVEDLGCLLHVAEQLLARDALQGLLAALAKAAQQVLVCQFGDDDQLAGNQVHPLQGEEKGMAHPLDALQRA